MKKITHITPHFAVTGALGPADFAEARRMGFRSIISNLPDGESAMHPTSAQGEALARQAGLAFRHVPAVKFDLFSERVLGGMQAALSEVEGPVLAHCASGLRSAFAWAGAAARLQPADLVLEALRRAGLDASTVSDEVKAQNSSRPAACIPTALDVGAVLESA
jgi:sulfide:quinone oxidoreductase